MEISLFEQEAETMSGTVSVTRGAVESIFANASARGFDGSICIANAYNAWYAGSGNCCQLPDFGVVVFGLKNRMFGNSKPSIVSISEWQSN